MEKLRGDDAAGMVSGLTNLREILRQELSEMEDILSVAPAAEAQAADMHELDILATCELLRTRILSGIASIDETLAWIRVCAQKDREGNELDCVRSLPYVNFSPPS